MTQPHDVLFASQQYQQWLAALKDKAMLATHNQAQAMMRAVLQELRDSVSDEDALAIANALPALPRGIMLEGWRLGRKKHVVASREAFQAALERRLGAHSPPPDDLTEAAFAVLGKALGRPAGEAVCGVLPAALQPLWKA